MSTSKGKEEQKGKKKSRRTTEEQKVSHSVNHPVRLDVVSILFERIASPNEMSAQLRVPVGNVSFHVTELFKDGVIELVKTEQRRGAIEHFYRARIRPEVPAGEWKEMPIPARREIARLALQAIFADSLSSLRQGKLAADDDMYVAWIPMALDEAGQDKVTDLQAEMLERLEAIKSEHEAAETEDGQKTPVRIAVTMWFERGGIGRAMPPLAVD